MKRNRNRNKKNRRLSREMVNQVSRSELNGGAENPKNKLTYELLEAFGGGGESISGVRVTQKKALGYSPILRAIELISGDVAKLPFLVYELVNGNRKQKKEVPEHPIYDLLYRNPSRWMTPFVWKEIMVSQALILGNAYAYIHRDENGKPIELPILDSDSVVPFTQGGELFYIYTNRGSTSKIPEKDIFHLRGIGKDLVGYNRLHLSKDSIGAMIAAREFGARYFKQNGKPGGYIKSLKKLSDAARTNMRESWERLHSGLSNAHKVAILEEGAEYGDIGAASARDSQMVEVRARDAIDVANIFGVPPHKLGDSSKVAYNSLDAENQSYFDDTLVRWLMRMSQEGNRKLLDELQRKTHECDFDYSEINRANVAVQTDVVMKLVNTRVLEINEGREIFGYPPLDESKIAAMMAIPFGKLPTTTDPTPTPAPNPTPAQGQDNEGQRSNPGLLMIGQGLQSIINQVSARMLKRVAAHAERLANPEMFERHAVAEHGRIIEENYGPVVAALRDAGLANVPGPEVIATEMIGLFVRTIKESVSNGQGIGEALERIRTFGPGTIYQGLTKAN